MSEAPGGEPRLSDRGWRDRVHEIIFGAETRAGRLFDIGLIIAILLSVTVVIVSTLPQARDEPAAMVFWVIEWLFTGLFTAEYLTRLMVARRPLIYALSFFGIIDLLSILPAFIGLIVPGGERLLVVRLLRLLRVFRVFKLARYLSEATALRDALYQTRHKIAVFITTITIIVVIMSAVMHVVESNSPGGNEAFESMPSAMYWAIITMTTVGYGDITPGTSGGKAATAVLVLLGYSMIIVPTGILSAEIVAKGPPKRPRIERVCPSCGRAGHDDDAHYCKDCGERMTGTVEPEA